MTYVLAEACNLRSGNLRIYLRKDLFDFKGKSCGSICGGYPPPPITPTPLALRRLGRLALADRQAERRLTAMAVLGYGRRPF